MSERAAMTVSELVAELSKFPGDTTVVIETPEWQYQAVLRLNPPCGDEDMAQRSVCIVGGEYV